MPLIDLPQFCQSLLAPSRRNKAALLLVPDARQVRGHAAQIAAAVGAGHLDFSSLFQSDPTLAGQLPVFDVRKTLNFIASRREMQPLWVVSGIEPIMAVWLSHPDPRQMKRDFCQCLELWEGPPAFLLVTCHDPVLAAYQPTRHTVGHFVMELSQTASLA